MKIFLVCIFCFVALQPASASENWEAIPDWVYEFLDEELPNFPSFGGPQSQWDDSFIESGINPTSLEISSPIIRYKMRRSNDYWWMDDDVDPMTLMVPAYYVFWVTHGDEYVGQIDILAVQNTMYSPRPISAKLVAQPGRDSRVYDVVSRSDGQFALFSLGGGGGTILLNRIDGEVYATPTSWYSARAMELDPDAEPYDWLPIDEAFRRITSNILRDRRTYERIAEIEKSGESRTATSIELSVYEAMIEVARQGRVEGLEVSGVVQVSRKAHNHHYEHLAGDDRVPAQFLDAFGAFIENFADTVDIASFEADSILMVSRPTPDDTDCGVAFSPVGFDKEQTRAVAFMAAYCLSGNRNQRYVLCFEKQGDTWEQKKFARLWSRNAGYQGSSN